MEKDCSQNFEKSKKKKAKNEDSNTYFSESTSGKHLPTLRCPYP